MRCCGEKQVNTSGAHVAVKATLHGFQSCCATFFSRLPVPCEAIAPKLVAAWNSEVGSRATGSRKGHMLQCENEAWKSTRVMQVDEWTARLI